MPWCCGNGLRLRGFDAEIVEITLSDPVPSELDLYTLGGAEDYAQRLATKHLIRYSGLQQAAARGAPVLAICAAIQVLGHWYETSSGERVDGVGLLDVTTSPQPEADHRRGGVEPLADRVARETDRASKTTVAERFSVRRRSPLATR